MENKVYTYRFETATPYLHPYQILHIFEEASGKFIHHVIVHESANTESRISLQILDPVLKHITIITRLCLIKDVRAKIF